MTRADAIRAQQQRPQLPAGWRVPAHPANAAPPARVEIVATAPERRKPGVVRLEAALAAHPSPLPYATNLAAALGMSREQLRQAMRALEACGVIRTYQWRQGHRETGAMGRSELRIVLGDGVALETEGWTW